MFVAANVDKVQSLQKTVAEPVFALLLAADLGAARQAAVSSWNWLDVGQDRYQGSGGMSIHALADGALNISADWPPGTLVYLGPGWHKRQDFKTIMLSLNTGVLMEIDPPNSGGR